MIIGIQRSYNNDDRSIRSRLPEFGKTCEFMVEPLFRAIQQKDTDDCIYAATVCDVDLLSKEWVSSVVGECVRGDDFCRNLDDSAKSEEYEKQIRKEDSLSSHLGMQALLMPCPKVFPAPNYARVLRSLCESLPANSYKQYWVYMPIDIMGENDGWAMWNSLRTLLNHHPKVGIVLTLHKNLLNRDKPFPTEMASMIVRRWTSEPIKALRLPDWAFNHADIPDCRFWFEHPALIPLFQMQKLHIIHTQSASKSDPDELPGNPMDYHMNDMLIRKVALEEHYNMCNFKDPLRGYRDTLQEPLQPLADDLENATYEVFEQDPVKYERYETAIFKALMTCRASSNSISYESANLMRWRHLQAMTPITGGAESSRKRKLNPSEDNVGLEYDHQKAYEEYKRCTEHLKPIQVAVVGAGRGPLVACALRAAAKAGIFIRLECLEKNPNAIMTLHSRRKHEEHWTDVIVSEGDMRQWTPADGIPVDIMVSELLGSWGDNELSPECLDGVLHYLSPNGICIPQKYDSFIAPISASLLWMMSRDVLQGRGLETPYVVNLHSCFYLDHSQKLFTFDHIDFRKVSICADNSHNRRFKTLRFQAEQSGTMHGLAGTFESQLYSDVMLSIRPETKNLYSKDMFSWFPMFIPFSTPVNLKKGDVIEVSVWRCTDAAAHKVWYEWCLTSPVHLPMHNSQGRSSSIRL